MKQDLTRKRIVLLSALVAGITLLHYITGHSDFFYHIVYRDLYFLPLILAGFWFGLTGALAASVSIIALYLPYIIINWEGFSPNDFNKIMMLLLFLVLSAVFGVIADREKARQKALREAESLAAMGKAISGVAHDMKTPLIAIGGFAKSIHKKLSEDDSNYEKIQAIVEETQRMDYMIKDMLDFSRPLDLNIAAGNINKLVKQCLLLLNDEAERRRVALDIVLSDRLPTCRFDTMRMEQVFVNLIVNALQASPENEVVTVRTYSKVGKIFFEVEDHGPGIPSHVREKIFIPFFTTKREGTGLGLAIALKIVQGHSGDLEVLKNPGKGITFRVSLPE